MPDQNAIRETPREIPGTAPADGRSLAGFGPARRGAGGWFAYKGRPAAKPAPPPKVPAPAPVRQSKPRRQLLARRSAERKNPMQGKNVDRPARVGKISTAALRGEAMDLFGRKAKAEEREWDAAQDDIYSGDFDRIIRGHSRRLAFSSYISIDRRVSTYRDRAKAYRNGGEWDLALADLNEAIRLYPEYANLYRERAYTYFLKGHVDSSFRTNYDKTADISFILDLDRHGGTWSDTANRDFDRAIADYDQAAARSAGIDACIAMMTT